MTQLTCVKKRNPTTRHKNYQFHIMPKLFSYVGDIVLDPFIGDDDIIIVIVQINRCTISVEIDKNCYQIVKKETFQVKS